MATINVSYIGMTQPTEQQIGRLTEDWEAIAGEPLVIEHTKANAYAFGSEVAILRLLVRYRWTEGARIKQTKGCKWIFSLPLNLGV